MVRRKRLEGDADLRLRGRRLDMRRVRKHNLDARMHSAAPLPIAKKTLDERIDFARAHASGNAQDRPLRDEPLRSVTAHRAALRALRSGCFTVRTAPVRRVEKGFGERDKETLGRAVVE